MNIAWGQIPALYLSTDNAAAARRDAPHWPTWHIGYAKATGVNSSAPVHCDELKQLTTIVY